MPKSLVRVRPGGTLPWLGFSRARPNRCFSAQALSNQCTGWRCIDRLSWQRFPGTWITSELPVSREQPRSLTTCRLLVTYLDRDMEFVWTPEHLDKMSWHQSSSVQIKPLQPTNSFFSANLATIRIDSLDFQPGRRSRRQIVSESPSCERRLLWAAS
jgi:hypothetical protein